MCFTDGRVTGKGWDADGDISGTNHNAHGGVFDGYNENANQTLKRSNEFCGLANTQTWPVPDDLFNCMVNASWLYGWDECMEHEPPISNWLIRTS